MWLLGSSVQPAYFKHTLRGKYPKMNNGSARKLLPMLRAGDKASKTALMEGSIEDALNVAGQYLAILKSKRFLEDIVAAAMLGLSEAVNRLETDHDKGNDRPMAFIVGGIHGAISKEIEAQKFIRADDRVNASLPTRITCPEAVQQIFDNTADKSSLVTEVEELLVGLAENELEEQIIELRKEGYNDQETADLIGVSRATVQVIRQGLNDRFMEAAGRTDNAKSKSTTRTRPRKPPQEQ